MNQILKYPGGKWREAPWIISHMPPHKVYVEPFFGSGGVFFNKAPAYINTINDLNGDIVNLFRVCRENPVELAELLRLTPWSREEYIACYDPAADPIERARRTVVRYHQSFGTSNSSRRSWKNVQTSGGPRCATMWNRLPDIVLDCCEHLKTAQIESIDAVEIIKRYDSADTLIYCDPPYLQSLRKRDLYKVEMPDKKHVELLEVIMRSKSMIVLSGYDNDMYNDALDGWFTAEKETTAQMGLKRTEKLWMNFNPPMTAAMI